MPINYLAAQALHHYAHEPSTPTATAVRADELYRELRSNLLNTVIGEYHRTGFFWEQCVLSIRCAVLLLKP
jgi:mannosyl-oligosaccharide glucosidase